MDSEDKIRLKEYVDMRLKGLEEASKQAAEDIRMLRESKVMLEGKASQVSANVAIVLAIFGLAISIISAIHSLMK